MLAAIRSLTSYQHLLDDISAGILIPGLALPRSARLPVLAALQADLNWPVLLLTDRADRALTLLDELSFWSKDSVRRFFPEPNPLFYEQAAWVVRVSAPGSPCFPLRPRLHFETSSCPAGLAEPALAASGQLGDILPPPFRRLVDDALPEPARNSTRKPRCCAGMARSALVARQLGQGAVESLFGELGRAQQPRHQSRHFVAPFEAVRRVIL